MTNMCPHSVLSFFSQWKHWLAPFLALLFGIVLIILAPILVVISWKNGITAASTGACVVAAGFVVLTVPLSLWDIVHHAMNYTKPSLQKHIIRILWMVPIYVLNAWIALVYPNQSIYLDALRECYEAYVIHNFMKYLFNYLNENQDLEATLENKSQVRHFFPLCCLPPWPMGHIFIYNCRHGILQYTVVRPLTSVISIICELCGVYGQSNFRPDRAFPYMLFVNNLSQMVSMYCLVLFYMANKVELQPIKPLAKFLCIKTVVFFSFFQSVVIDILVFTGVISSFAATDDKEEIRTISAKLQAFLICMEMFLAAIAHHYSFSYRPFVQGDRPPPSCLRASLAMLDVRDVRDDITEHLGVVGSSFTRRLRGKSNYTMARGCDESSRLISEEVPSIATPALTVVVTPPPLDARPTAYGSVDTTVTLRSTNSDADLIEVSDENTKGQL